MIEELIAGIVLGALFLSSWWSNRTPRTGGPFDPPRANDKLDPWKD